jgi:hypothetical protein
MFARLAVLVQPEETHRVQKVGAKSGAVRNALRERTR